MSTGPHSPALAVPADLAESVCYGIQLAGLPGKFDPAKATELGVPFGPIRGKLVRGENITLEDGTTITADQVGTDG